MKASKLIEPDWLGNLWAGQRPPDWGMRLIGSFHFGGKLISKSNWKPKGRAYLPKKYADFENRIAVHAKAAHMANGYPSGWVVIYPVFPTRTHVDLSNLPKSIIDGLVKGGVFSDDKNVSVTVTAARYAKDGASLIEVWA